MRSRTSVDFVPSFEPETPTPPCGRLPRSGPRLERVERFPELGRPTEDADIRQIVVAFGAAGYIVRYRRLVDTGDLFVTRIWHAVKSVNERDGKNGGTRHAPYGVPNSDHGTVMVWFDWPDIVTSRVSVPEVITQT